MLTFKDDGEEQEKKTDNRKQNAYLEKRNRNRKEYIMMMMGEKNEKSYHKF